MATIRAAGWTFGPGSSDVPGRAERGAGADAGHVEALRLCAGARQGGHHAGGQVDGAYRVVLGVGGTESRQRGAAAVGGCGRRAMPCGWSKRASASGPSALPRSPEPMTRRTRAAARHHRPARPCREPTGPSAYSQPLPEPQGCDRGRCRPRRGARPAAPAACRESAAAPAGSGGRRRAGRASGRARLARRPRRRAPEDAGARSSASTSPGWVPASHPSASTRTRVGQAFTPKARQTRYWRSLTTGCSTPRRWAAWRCWR